MKKPLLLIMLLLVGLYTYSQSNKTDTIQPYHFSLKNGWALKVNPLQMLADYELRVYLEKEISKNARIEIFGSYYHTDFPLTDLYWVNQIGLSYLSYASKIGIGYKYFSNQHPKRYNDFELFYKYFERDGSYQNKDPNLYPAPIIINANSSYKVVCLQYNLGRRYQSKRFLFDVYFGAGFRVKFQKSILIPRDLSYEIINTPWSLEGIPSLQMGMNIGLKTN
ncbi:MAG: hypothetical protein RL708_2256 [Bacteroidota bacterium]|jgi:hypothetical protein